MLESIFEGMLIKRKLLTISVDSIWNLDYSKEENISFKHSFWEGSIGREIHKLNQFQLNAFLFSLSYKDTNKKRNGPRASKSFRK